MVSVTRQRQGKDGSRGARMLPYRGVCTAGQGQTARAAGQGSASRLGSSSQTPPRSCSSERDQQGKRVSTERTRPWTEPRQALETHPDVMNARDLQAAFSLDMLHRRKVEGVHCQALGLSHAHSKEYEASSVRHERTVPPPSSSPLPSLALSLSSPALSQVFFDVGIPSRGCLFGS